MLPHLRLNIVFMLLIYKSVKPEDKVKFAQIDQFPEAEPLLNDLDKFLGPILPPPPPTCEYFLGVGSHLHSPLSWPNPQSCLFT